MSSLQVHMRYKRNHYVTLANRYSRIEFSGLAQDTVLSFLFFYSYDTANERPMWKELHNACASAVVVDGKAFILILYGPAPPGKLPAHIVHIQLPRPDPGLSLPPLPHLSYTVCTQTGEFVYNDRIHLCQSWEDVVFDEALLTYQRLRISQFCDFVSTQALFADLNNSWRRLFASCVKTTQREAVTLYVDNIPEFNVSTLLRLYRIVYPFSDPPTVLPDIVPWHCICGATARQSQSIIRVFSTLADLLGRSSLVRHLYKEQKIALAGPHDIVEFQVGDAQLPPYIFFFRLPRSPVHEPALVIQIYTKNDHGHWTPISPTPFVTASHLEKAGGDPLRAFKKLNDSVHIDILKQLSYDGMLNVCWKSPISFHLLPPTIFSVNDTENYCDPTWWESIFELK